MFKVDDTYLHGLASKAVEINCPTWRATEALVNKYKNLSLSEKCLKFGAATFEYRCCRSSEYWLQCNKKWYSSSIGLFSWFWFVHCGWIQNLWFAGIFRKRSVSILSGSTPSLSWASRFLRINGRHERVYLTVDKCGTNGENRVLYVLSLVAARHLVLNITRSLLNSELCNDWTDNFGWDASTENNRLLRLKIWLSSVDQQINLDFLNRTFGHEGKSFL